MLQAQLVPPNLRLKREKTVFEHMMTDNEKDSMYKEMQMKSESYHKRMIENKERQEAKVIPF